MRIFLCGQTGNINRGCEAIIRSTVKVLEKPHGEVYLATFAPQDDAPMTRELGIHMIPYAKYPTKLHRYFCGGWRKLWKHSVLGTQYTAAPLYARMGRGDICLNIGGDVYCYSRPMQSIALNHFTTKNHIDNYLWCCSIEKSVIHGEVLEDLKRYHRIFAREQITYQNLLSAGIPREKIVKVCDPAFFLGCKEVPLPAGFVRGNTVGINISECVIEPDAPLAYENVLQMARYILEHTDMSICLIPHVYRIAENRNDWPILNRLMQDLNSSRVGIVDQEYDCEQLKYIISQCRFLVCARTHASIAAYSTEVPTLVLGYSVKSRGLAMDLFGTDENYVVTYQELQRKEELTEAFTYIMAHEQQIRQRLQDTLPAYKQQLLDAVAAYIAPHQPKPGSICDREVCSGCGACAAACPTGCIEMKADPEGFLRPCIQEGKCVQCGKCRRVCPVVEPRGDDNREPAVYGAFHKDSAIRAASSSGGVFTALAQAVLREGGVVFGGAFDEHFHVVHKYIDHPDQLEQLRGSKYVQSDMGNAYGQAQEFLKQGRQVLFSGAPCQIEGLQAYLGRDYENLLTVDFVCHGVPSPKLWEKYLQFREKEAGAEVKAVSMRDKSAGWKLFSMGISFADGGVYTQKLTEDFYLRGFLMDLFLRPSCHICPFRKVHRSSDITLADYWNVKENFPEQADDRGVSLVLVHHRRGEALLDACRKELTLWQTDYKDILRGNPSTLRSKPAPKLRSAFMKDADRLPFDKLYQKYCSNRLGAKARRFLAKKK